MEPARAAGQSMESRGRRFLFLGGLARRVIFFAYSARRKMGGEKNCEAIGAKKGGREKKRKGKTGFLSAFA
jgi:hypothetical protein